MAFISILLFSWVHPFHLSVTNIYYKEKEKIIQVEHRIFLDDLEEALRDYSGTEKLDIIEDDQENLNRLITEYLNERLAIVVKEKTIDLVFIGKEVELDQNVLWCYFEAQKVKKFDAFKVRQSVLLEKFSDQENIVNYDPKGNTLTHRSNKKKEWLEFNILKD